MAFNFNDLQAQRFQDDLRAAAGYKPLLKSDLQKAYSRYKDVGVKMGRVKGKTDAQLYRMATRDVLAWWKAQQADKSAGGQTPTAPSTPAPPAGGASGGSSGAPSAGGGSPTGGTTRSSRSMLPNTAVGPRGTATKLVPISYVLDQLARHGLGGARPPAYAYNSKEDFDAWLRRALRLRTQQTYGTPVIVAPTSPQPGIPLTQESTVTRRVPTVN